MPSLLSIAAQTPSLSIKSRRVSAPDAETSVPVSPIEAAYRVRAAHARFEAAVSYRNNSYPEDSIRTNVAALAGRWIQYLSMNPIRGIQIDGYGSLMVQANQDSAARAQISIRLATPGLTIEDKAYTYFIAIKAFSDERRPDRLVVAEEYQRGLNALGPSAALWQLLGHRALQAAYYGLGKSADVVRHGQAALALAAAIDYVDRTNILFAEPGVVSYFELVEAASIQRDVRKKLKWINSQLLQAATAPPALIALDSNFASIARKKTDHVNYLIHLTNQIGTKGADVVGNYWVNLDAPGEGHPGVRSLSVSAGKVTVLAVGSYTCSPCMASLAGMQRLHRRFPQIQMVFATWTSGFLGNRLVDGTEEADTLARQFVRRNKVTEVPISIWNGKKVVRDDDGVVPEDAGPNLVAYPLIVKPTIYVLDGRGIIRYVNLGGLDRNKEAQMIRTIEFLLKESTGVEAAASSL